MSELQAPPVSLLDKYTGSEVLPLYTTSVTVSGGEAGHGRASGHAVSNDGALDLVLRLPRELGGPGKATNPEQLLAAGYAACFHGALMLVARKNDVALRGVTVTGKVTFGRDPSDGLYLLVADIDVSLPDIDHQKAQFLLAETEKICPYAKMVRQGANGTVRLI